jgi:transcriptional regulator with XRE-family HTH domain
MSLVGNRIRQRRHELDWSQDVLAQQAGISKSFLSDLENGKRSVGADTLLEIARVLGLSLDYLMQGTDTDTESPSKDIHIPASLSAFAKAADISYSQTLMLLDMQRQIIAHRSTTKNRDLEDVDWRKFYESVKDFL